MSSREVSAPELLEQLESLHEIGIALSAEKHLPTLLERILVHARELSGADAGTIYVKDPGRDDLRFAVLQNDSLGLVAGGTSGRPIELDPIPLHLPDGRPNHETVAAFAAVEGRLVHVADAYETGEFDFSGTKGFDQRTGYRSKSFLTAPMTNPAGEVVGVLQLINAKDPETGEIIEFSAAREAAIASLASQAAVALSNRFETEEVRALAERLHRLSEIGAALSAEKDIDVLLEQILENARWLARADGGTLYLLAEDRRHLRFAILRNESLEIELGGTTGRRVAAPPIPLFHEDGEPNRDTVAAEVALTGETVSIPDAYEAEGYDFSGTKRFDLANSYRSRSFLTVPLKDHEDQLLGVLQLINARSEDGATVAFDEPTRVVVEALASQAAVALTNRKLFESLQELFDSFIRVIATAIDRKSPFTSGHCQRVPVLTLMLADAASAATEGPLADFELDEDGRYELQLAAWLHDCGKVVTPQHVMDKSTKLETVRDGIETVRTRFEVLERDAEIAWLRRRLEAHGDDVDPASDPELGATLDGLREERAFLESSNRGGEFMGEELRERVRRIGARRWRLGGEERPLLDEDEIESLTVSRGTLTAEERKIINDHVVISIEMLEQLPFPRKLRRVAEYAGGHHEKCDGTGYPNGLKRHEMSWQARIMAIADIFEALTAPDRPYRDPNDLAEAMRILGFMKRDGHVDPDLFDLFVREEVYLEYAREHLKSEQIVDVDESSIPGYGDG